MGHGNKIKKNVCATYDGRHVEKELLGKMTGQ